MACHAWVLEVRPGYEDEYKKRHDDIWPEMLDALRKAGIRNYNIFRHGLTPSRPTISTRRSLCSRTIPSTRVGGPRWRRL